MLSALLLFNLPQVLGLSQRKIMLVEKGVSPADTTTMISAFAMGILLGRLASGLALDRYPAHVVGMVSMGLPSLGFFLLATSLDAIMRSYFWLFYSSVFHLGPKAT